VKSLEELLKQILGELKKLNEKPIAPIDKKFETVPEFAERAGLPERVIRMMARQGQLPILDPKAYRPKIEVEGAIEVLKKSAGKTAEEILLGLPAPIKIMPARTKKERQRASGMR